MLAHHYMRYLGDLSGGQAIGRILHRTFDLDGAGIAFYDFPAIPKPKPYKDAFGLNQALFVELSQNLAEYSR